MHYARPTPLHTTLQVNITPMSRPHSPPVLSQIHAYNYTINPTPFNHPLPSFHPTIPRSLHTESIFYLPHLPPPTAPIVILTTDPPPTTHIPNSYVILFRKESCTCFSLQEHHTLSTSLPTHTQSPDLPKTNTRHVDPHPKTILPHAEPYQPRLTPPPHSATLQLKLRQLPTTHVPFTSLTIPTRTPKLTKTNTLHIESHPPPRKKTSFCKHTHTTTHNQHGFFRRT